MASDDGRGVYRKHRVERTDGSSGPGGKHERCAYFVLDLEHDKYAVPALRAYAKACAKKFPELARDIRRIINHPRHRSCGCRGLADCTHNMFTPNGPSEMADHVMRIWRAEPSAGAKEGG